MGVLAMIWAAVVQHYIYQTNACGKNANACSMRTPAEVSSLNVWIQTGSYVFIGFAEIFASITGLEYAFTKAPKNMRSLVTGLFLFSSAVSSAIAQGFTALSEDPLLVWNYTTVAIIATVFGTAFWFANRALDHEEDHLNMLPESTFKGRVAEEPNAGAV